MPGAIFDHALTEHKTNLINGRVDAIGCDIASGSSGVSVKNLCPGYDIERTGAGTYTLTFPKAEYASFFVSCEHNDNPSVDYTNALEGTVDIVTGADPGSDSSLSILVALGDNNQ